MVLFLLLLGHPGRKRAFIIELSVAISFNNPFLFVSGLSVVGFAGFTFFVGFFVGFSALAELQNNKDGDEQNNEHGHDEEDD